MDARTGGSSVSTVEESISLRTIGFFGILYFMTALACGALPSWPGWAIHQWLPGGLLLGWLARTSPKNWPALLLAAAFATLAFGLLRPELPASRQIGYFVANILGAVASAAWLRRGDFPSSPLATPEQFGRFLLAGCGGSLFSTAVLPLTLPDGYGIDNLHQTILTWFFNAQAGIWVLAPLVLVWSPERQPGATPQSRRRIAECALLLGVLLYVLVWLAPLLGQIWTIEPRYLALPAICWAAVRLGRTCTGITIIAATQFDALRRTGDSRANPEALFDARLDAFMDAGLLAVFGYGLALTFYAQRRSRIEAERLAAVVQKTGASVVLTDAECRITWTNAGFTALTGYTAEQALGKKHRELLQCSETDEATLARIAERLRSGRGFNEVLINRRQDGGRFWNRVDVEPLHGPDGRLRGFFGVQFDVTRLREAESLRAFISQAPVALAMIDRDSRVLVASRSWTTLVAADAPLPAGTPLRAIIPSPPKGWLRLLATSPGESKHGSEGEDWTRADGTALVLRWTASPWHGATESAGGFILFAEDISSRLAAERLIRTEAERFDLLTRATHELVWDWDLASGSQWWNDAYHAFFGTDPARFSPTYEWWLDRVHPEDRPVIQARFATFAASREIRFSAEFRLKSADNRYPPMNTQAYCLRDASGAIIRMIGSVEDLSAKREAAEARLIRGKLEATGTLAAGIAHDFNNLSTSLMLNLDLALLKGREDFAKAVDFIRSAQDSVMTSRALTERLLTFSEGGAAVRTAIDPARLLRRAAEPALIETGVRLRLELAENLPWMEGEEHQLEQAFRSLATNACEAMPEGGELTLAAQEHLVTKPGPDGTAPGRYVRVLVCDQGPGIPPEMASRIFDPYFSTKPRGNRKGQGLGLTICQSILRRHGGSIRLEPEKRGGAVFEVLVPALARSHNPGTAHPASLDSANRRSLRVLVMDDETSLRESLGELLSLHGEEVTLAADGDEAVARFSAALKEGRPFDVVVLDLIIHGGKGGEMTLHELRALDPNVAAIAISGYAQADAMRNHERHGFSAAAPKPFKMSELIDLIRRTASRKRS